MLGCSGLFLDISHFSSGFLKPLVPVLNLPFCLKIHGVSSQSYADPMINNINYVHALRIGGCKDGPHRVTTQ